MFEKAKLSFATIKKKLVNNFCKYEKLTLGNKDLVRTFHTLSIKNNHSLAQIKPKEGKGKKTKIEHYFTTVVQQPVETIKKLVEHEKEDQYGAYTPIEVIEINIEDSESKSEKGKTHCQRERKNKKHQSSAVFESEDEKSSKLEIDELFKGIRSNMDAMNDMSRILMNTVQGVKKEIDAIKYSTQAVSKQLTEISMDMADMDKVIYTLMY